MVISQGHKNSLQEIISIASVSWGTLKKIIMHIANSPAKLMEEILENNNLS